MKVILCDWSAVLSGSRVDGCDNRACKTMCGGPGYCVGGECICGDPNSPQQQPQQHCLQTQQCSQILCSSSSCSKICLNGECICHC